MTSKSGMVVMIVITIIMYFLEHQNFQADKEMVNIKKTN